MNGHVAMVSKLLTRSIVLQMADGNLVSMPLTRRRSGRAGLEAFSLTGGYAMTIHKAQGLTLSRVVIYWDHLRAQAGLGYTALSRVRQLRDISFIGEMRPQHFKPTS